MFFLFVGNGHVFSLWGMGIFLCDRVLLHYPVGPKTHDSLLPQPLRCLDYRHEPLCPDELDIFNGRLSQLHCPLKLCF